MYDGVRRPQGVTNLPPHSQEDSDRHELEFRSNEHRAGDQGSRGLFPGIVGTEQERLTSRASHFSIARKPVSHQQSSVSASDKKGLYAEVDPSYTSKQQEPKDHFDFFRFWWLELLCCVVFIGALVAVVVTIRPYEEHPLPQWPYHLSINSLIAIYVVILKAAILLVAAEGLNQLKWRWFYQDRPLRDLLSYDSASRGPWGSLVLLWRLRGRQLVSSCGAFITLAALITDPFAPQVIATYDCPIAAESAIATVPRTNNFDESGPHTGASLARLSLGLQNSVNAGIFDPGQSVALIVQRAIALFRAFTTPWGIAVTATIPQMSSPNTSTAQNLSAVLNNTYGSGLSDYLIIKTVQGRTDLVLGLSNANLSTSCSGSCPLLDDAHYDTCNANWEKLRWGCTGIPQSSAGIGTARCSLFPCVRTYKAAVLGGKWSESLVSEATEWSLATNGPQLSSSMVSVECLNAQDQESLTNAGYDFEGRAWIPYNMSVDSSGNFSSGNSYHTNMTKGAVSSQCIYEVGGIAINSIGTFLGTFLNGTIQPGSYYSYDYSGAAQMQAIYNEGYLTFDRLDQTWRNVSDSITTYMREHGDANFSVPARGIAFRDQTCVHIRWGFLAYPAVLVLLAIIFFVCMVYETRRGPTSRHDWKSSPLPLLFHGLDREALRKEDLVDVVRAKEMDLIAARMPVRLAETENGWHFTRSQDGFMTKR